MARRAAPFALLAGLLLMAPVFPALSTPLPAAPADAPGQAVFDRVDAAWLLEHPSMPTPASVANAVQAIPPSRVFVHNSSGALGSLPPGYPAAFSFLVADVGAKGPEPSVGVDGAGHMYFKTCCAGKVRRSDDGGFTWTDATSALASTTTIDPMLWLDPATGRVFNNDLTSGCSWSTWTQPGNELGVPGVWEGFNPLFCPLANTLGTVDHQKITTGNLPADHPLKGVAPNPTHGPEATYFAWNTGAQGRIALSVDGGQSFLPQVTTVQGTCSGGLHGRPRVLDDGVILVPKRDCGRPLVLRSADVDHWQSIPVGASVASTSHRKNPDLAADRAGNAYLFWPGGCADGLCAEPTWMSRSTDEGLTWSNPVKASPPNVRSSTFHASVAGAPGKVAVLYYGNDHTAAAPDHVRGTKWHAYISFSLDALSADPTWVTVQLDDDNDPIQIGSISTNSDGHAEAGSRNLLDFTDLVLTPDGRVIAAYADGCTTVNNCANNAAATSASSRDNEGIAAILQGGPVLG